MNDCGHDRFDSAVQKEFARLRATNEDLLAALETIVNEANNAREAGCKTIYLATGDGGKLDAARAAIARARGTNTNEEEK